MRPREDVGRRHAVRGTHLRQERPQHARVALNGSTGSERRSSARKATTVCCQAGPSPDARAGRYVGFIGGASSSGIDAATSHSGGRQSNTMPSWSVPVTNLHLQPDASDVVGSGSQRPLTVADTRAAPRGQIVFRHGLRVHRQKDPSRQPRAVGKAATGWRESRRCRRCRSTHPHRGRMPSLRTRPRHRPRRRRSPHGTDTASTDRLVPRARHDSGSVEASDGAAQPPK